MYISWNFQLVEWVFPHVKLIPFKSIHKWKYMTLLPQLFYTQIFFCSFSNCLIFMTFLSAYMSHKCFPNFFILRNFSCALRGNVFHWGIFIFFMEIFHGNVNVFIYFFEFFFISKISNFYMWNFLLSTPNFSFCVLIFGIFGKFCLHKIREALISNIPSLIFAG